MLVFFGTVAAWMGVLSFADDFGFGLAQSDAVFFGTLALSAVVGAGLALRRDFGAPPEAAHLKLEADKRELERGGSLVVVPQATERPAGAPFEVGLECLEIYDEWVDRHGKILRGITQELSMRDTLELVVWETWVEAAAGQPVAFDVPPDAPFSWEGDCLSFAWRAVARERDASGAGGRRTLPIWVRP